MKSKIKLTPEDFFNIIKVLVYKRMKSDSIRIDTDSLIKVYGKKNIINYFTFMLDNQDLKIEEIHLETIIISVNGFLMKNKIKEDNKIPFLKDEIIFYLLDIFLGKEISNERLIELSKNKNIIKE